MKASILIFTIFTLVFSRAPNLYSQNGLEVVYEDNGYGIAKFTSVKIDGDNDRKILVQFNGDTIFFQDGECKKLNKTSNTLTTVYNRLLNTDKFFFCKDYLLFPIKSFVISPSNEQILMYNVKTDCDTAFADETYYSLNGATRNNIPISNCAGFDISDNSEFYVAGTNDLGSYSIYKSTNSGGSWFVTDTLAGLKKIGKGGFIECSPVNENILYVTGNSNLFVSTNSGYNFINTNAPSFKKIYFNNGRMFGISENHLFTSTDNGMNWVKIYTSFTFEYNCLEFSSENDQLIFAGTPFGIFKSTDAGYSWNFYNNAFPVSKNILGLSKDPLNGSPLYACTSKGIYKVINEHYEPVQFISHFHTGNYFEYIFDNFPMKKYYSITIMNDTIINGIKYYKLLNSNNSYTFEFIDSISQKWYSLSDGCPDGNALVVDFNADIGEVDRLCNNYRETVGKGVSNNILGDTTHLRYSVNYPYPFIFDANTQKYSEKFGFINSNGFGSNITLKGAIIDGVTYGVIQTSVNNISNIVPEQFKLHQNYPNPFNPVTKIKFDIPSSINHNVRLTVYDALGKELKVLVNEKLSAGSYEADFNAGNFASGSYFYKLEAGSFVETKRMIVLK